MRRKATAVCIDCGQPPADGAQLSYRGLCVTCGAVRHAAAIAGMTGGQGAAYERWAASNGPAGRPPRGKGVPPA